MDFAPLLAHLSLMAMLAVSCFAFSGKQRAEKRRMSAYAMPSPVADGRMHIEAS